ncbi:MAG: HAMP domain-containing histidine kinase [Solirubrobacteraceae bacterium MAG38_C4-C5]|nr:HAMP domain-containing histidine kinase [Candidatus Siliceabacter maunaloa]
MIVIDEVAKSPPGTVFDRPAREGAGREARPRRKAAHGGALGLSHDIRVSVTALRLLIEGMSDGVFDLADPSYLARMKTHVTFLTDLLEEPPDTLEPVSTQVGPTLRPTDLGVLLERWSHAMHEAARAKEVEIRVCVQDELPPVACQPEQISRVILNLVDNAIRHSPRKGVVVLGAVARAGEIEVQVDDSGPGLPASTAERVQAEHRPAHAGDGRRGLGLLIARSIVEFHGGRVWIAPQPRGTSVRFSVPTGEL